MARKRLLAEILEPEQKTAPPKAATPKGQTAAPKAGQDNSVKSAPAAQSPPTVQTPVPDADGKAAAAAVEIILPILAKKLHLTRMEGQALANKAFRHFASGTPEQKRLAEILAAVLKGV